MPEPRPDQMQLGFDARHQADGYRAWLLQREQAIAEFARQRGLPLGHEVEVWLRDGVLLKGRLLLRTEEAAAMADKVLDLDLVIGRATFKASEIESCVRMD